MSTQNINLGNGTLSINGAVEYLAAMEAEYRMVAAFALLQHQFSVFLARERFNHFNMSVLLRSFGQAGDWMRKVNSKGNFDLPLKNLEIVLFRDVEKATGFKVWSLAGLICDESSQAVAQFKKEMYGSFSRGYSPASAHVVKRSYRRSYTPVPVKHLAATRTVQCGVQLGNGQLFVTHLQANA